MLGSKVLESLRLALGTVRSHKMRSSLVILGVGIGVTTLMGMVTILLGLGDKISDDIRSSDNAVIYLARFDLLVGGDPSQFAHRPEINPRDLEAVRNEIPSVRLADFQQQPQWQTILHYKGEKTGIVAVIGTTTHFPKIFTIDVKLGRNFSEEEEEHRARVVVLGHGPYMDLFPQVDPIGKRVRIRGEAYTVVGVFEEREHLLGRLADNYVTIPYTSFRKEWGAETDQIVVAIVPREGEPQNEVMDDVTALMRQRHGLRPGDDDDFDVSSADAVEELVGSVTGPIGLVLAVVASIGLMVGGIGVMAIMLVSVTERTREIGIRTALGASRSDILYQFLIEASTLTGMGGIAGITLGILLAKLVAALIHLPTATPFTWTALAVVVSAGIGIVFGMYPALRASRLDPIEAIRNE
jgi:putative ABC transport system permease protein